MTILHMSVSASVLIALAAMIRAIAIHRLPKKTFLVLWGMALCRLLIPFDIPTPSTGHTVVGRAAEKPAEPQFTETIIANSAVRMAADSSSQQQTLRATDVVFPSISPYVLVWAAGAIAMAAFFLVTHWRCLREYKTALPVRDRFPEQWLAKHRIRRPIRIRLSDQILSPLTYGVWRPVILLPKTMDLSDQHRLAYILTHELIHIKRFDTLVKWLLSAALCVHWFNPLVWVMYVLANRDLELSCDEAVVRTFGESGKSVYARTLVSMAEAGSKFVRLHSGFSKNPLKERIVAIMKMKIKKTNLAGAILSIALVAGTGAAFAASELETRSLGVFEEVFGGEARQYAEYLNKVSEETALVRTQDYALYLDSTLFTDHHVYAVVGLEGDWPEELAIGGRIVHAGGDQTFYGLAGEVKEIKSAAGNRVRYYLYSAGITPGVPEQGMNAQAVLAAGDQFRKFNSLWEHEGALLELTVNLAGKEHLLTATVANVFTEAIVVRPDAAHYHGEYYDTIFLRPAAMKMTGTSNRKHEELWIGPPVSIAIVLTDGTRIHISNDTRGLVSDEGYPTAGSRGHNDITGEFYNYWDFRGWNLDLKKVKALVIDGVTYRVG